LSPTCRADARHEAFDPMYGAAVRCKRFRRSVGAVLHQCIRPHVGALLRATMDISAHAFLLAARPRSGHLGHQCSHAPGRPVLHLVSSSRRPRRKTGIDVTSSVAHLSVFLCSCHAGVLSSRPAVNIGRRAQGRQGWPSRLALRGCTSVSRPRLDGPEHDATIKQIEVSSHSSWRMRSCAPC
jgi:hypothetical protein